jgi:hypothetical protein
MTDDEQIASFFPFATRTSEIFNRIAWWRPFGPWTVSVFDPKSGRQIGRRYFPADQAASLQQWLSQLQLQFDFVKWFVASGKEARK